MKKLSDTQIKLLAALADGNCHSGTELGLALKVSRTAIWKQIKQLSHLGLAIQRLPQQGYRLPTPLTLLNEKAIRQQLQLRQFNKSLNLQLFAALDSTNRFLKDLALSTDIDICCTEMQTAGRGRFGRSWYSPFGENIYCSSRWHFDSDLSHLSGLSLVVSLAILAALDEFGIRDGIRVKWPNDILWHHKKLCGNLIEVVAESNSSAEIIIGIGVNVNSDSLQQVSLSQTPPDKAWCSLYDISKTYIDRNQLIASLIIQLEQFLNEFMQQGFVAFMSKWQQVDYLQGQMITVSQPTGHLSGTAAGVNEMGQLILIDEKGNRHYLSSGDTSLRLE